MCQPQGCVVIFLSYFLALLVKVGVAREGFISALGGMLVAINVILVLAVLFASWFTVQPSTDSSRDEEDTVPLANAMLTVQQDTTKSTRLIRDGNDNISATSVVRGGSATFGSSAIRRGTVAPYRVFGGGASRVTVQENAVPSLAREGSITAAMV